MLVAASFVLLVAVATSVPGAAADSAHPMVGAASEPTTWAVYSPGGDTELIGVSVASDAIVGTIKIPNSIGESIDEFTAGELAISPNGATAYLCVEAKREVLPIDLTNETLGTPIKVHNDPVAIAIMPNGSRMYVLGYVSTARASVIPVTISNGTAGRAISVGPLESAGPGGIAITPNGKNVWVSSSVNGTLSSISVATGKVVGKPITVGAFPIAVAITPNRKTAWVANSQDDDVVPVDLADGAVGKKVRLNGAPDDLSITPSGRYAFVPLASPATGAVRVGLGGARPVKTIALFDPSRSRMQAAAVAVSPEGNQAFFGAASEGYVARVDVGTALQNASIELSTGVSEVSAIAITPDQAPTARFTLLASGRTVKLDASSSSAWFGTITHYAWTFGDGTSSHSTGPTVSHTYGKAGKYTITLVVTDSLGTSTSLVFTGQTVSRNGGPRASTSTVVKVT